VSEKIGETSSDESEQARARIRIRKRRTGAALFVVGVLLFICGLVFIYLAPSDIETGHHFWTSICVVDIIVALVLMWIGHGFRRQAKLPSDD